MIGVAAEPKTGGLDAGETHALQEAFAAFQATTAALERSHGALQGRVAELERSLAAKVRELEELRGHLADVLASISDGVVAVDLDGRVTTLNAAAAALLGCDPVEELAPGGGGAPGRPLEELAPGAAALARLLDRARTRAGEAAGPSEDCRIEPADGGAPGVPGGAPGVPGGARLVSASASPVRAADARDGEADARSGAVVTFRDLTEVRELERRLARQERLAVLGRMAAQVAHEVRNPLGSLSLYASLLERAPELDGPSKELVGKILRSSALLDRVVESMLDFTRELALAPAPLDLFALADEAVAFSEAEAEAQGVAVEVEAGGRVEVVGDYDYLLRAALNLVRNAVEASAGAPDARVRVRAAAERTGAVALSVADAGPGVPPDKAKEIFNPFYTDRPRGTGLGLAIVQRIAEAHGGLVSVESPPGGEGRSRDGEGRGRGGAVFTMRLPAAGPGKGA